MPTKQSFSFLLMCLLVGQVASRPSGGRLMKRETELPSGTRDKVPSVYLTVSSLTSRTDRLLELNWENLPAEAYEDDDYRINLYNRDPLQNPNNPLVSVTPDLKGYYRTTIRFPEQIFTDSNLSESCLGYWIAFLKNEESLVSNCVRPQPHWMYESQSAIRNSSLLDLMIPGTHNTGSYTSFDPTDNSIFNRYLFTQEESIWNQLVYGIRYLDIRVAYQRVRGSEERFWITHSSFRIDTTVREVMQQVKKFLQSTREIVILDFHRFVTGFQNKRSSSTMSRHRELITMLEEEVGEFMIPVQFTSHATLDKLWENDKRLYVGYADERSRRQSMFLFPAIKHLWGDVDEVDDLKLYLNDTVCNPRRTRLTSAMAQLTPKTSGVLFNVYGGLRKLGDEVNRQVTRWFREEWKHCANIVATDFFLGNNMIELAIETNKNKFTDT